MTMSAKIPVIDLFSGAGGLSCGLRSSGLEVRAAVEIDKNAISTYKRNIGSIVLEKDIKKVTGKELLEFAKIEKGELFILAGCPPCQGFSSVGPREKNDIRNELVFQYVRLIKETKPWFILMENVPGMSRGIGKEIFEKVKEQLEKDYVICYEILNSADYGIPQHRKRLVLHGISKKIVKKYLPKDFELVIPTKTHCNPKDLEKLNLRPWETVSIISDLPELKAGGKHDVITNHQCRALSELNLKRIRATEKNGGSRSDWSEELFLDCHSGEKVGYKDVYGRMDYGKQAPTITAGCLSYSKGRFGHPIQDRAISAREAARLQSFDDDFVFEGNLDCVGRQIGNAVPPKLAEASGKHFLEIINKYNLIRYRYEVK